jgi:lipoate-protein ligase A
MKFLVLDSTNPHRNLAIEEYLFLHSDEDVFMLWQNAPTVVIGKNQNAHAEIDLALARERRARTSRGQDPERQRQQHDERRNEREPGAP